MFLYTTSSHATVPVVDLQNQINSSKNITVITVKTTSTPVWVAPMIALPWLLLLIGILSVLMYIVIIKGMLIIGARCNGKLNWSLLILQLKRANGNRLL